MTTISLKEFFVQDSLWGGKPKAKKKDHSKSIESFLNAKASVDGEYVRVNIRTLSQNDCWVGQRFKTPLYDKYERALRRVLPPVTVLKEKKYRIDYEFGFSNVASDIDNPVKSLTDVLQKLYQFNDKNIYEMNLRKVIVKRGEEYLKFKFTEIQ